LGKKNSWICRLYKADDYENELTIIGNFQQYHNRQRDSVVVFSGMYGIDDYFIWYMHKNIGAYDFSTINIDLKLFLDGSIKKPFWHKQYKVLDVKYNAKSSKFVLFGMSLDSVKLQSKLVDYNVKSLSWNDNRSPKDVLIDVLEVNNIFKVEYMESVYEANLRNFEYRMFTFDENWKVIDFINYIADQNHFEWYVRNSVLYIGNECKAIRGMNSTRKFDLETDNVSESAWFKKYYGVTRPMDIMSHISEVWRCIWVKHEAGRSGGLSKGCFTKIGIGTLDKENYLKTLEGQPEKTIATKLFINKPYSHYIGLGNILKDQGEIRSIDEVSVQRNKELYKINEPSEVKFDRGDEATSPLTQIKERISRSTQYLDDGAGLLFPSSKLEDDEGEPIVPPNSLIFKVNGKEEASVVGPFVYGNRKIDFVVPLKGKNDFRLSFPNGWTLYVDEEGRTMLQSDGRETDKADPYANDVSKATTYMYMKPAGLGGQGAAFSFNCVDGENTDENKPHGGLTVRFTENNGVSFRTKHKSNFQGINALFEKTKYKLTAHEDVTDLSNPPSTDRATFDMEKAKINLKHEKDLGLVELEILPDEIRIEGLGNFISITSNGIELDCSGNITLNATGNITIDGLQTLIQGGLKALAHANHTHLVSAMPGPPGLVTGPCLDNTIKTKAD
jgi:hypothetical protein